MAVMKMALINAVSTMALMLLAVMEVMRLGVTLAVGSLGTATMVTMR